MLEREIKRQDAKQMLEKLTELDELINQLKDQNTEMSPLARPDEKPREQLPEWLDRSFW